MLVERERHNQEVGHKAACYIITCFLPDPDTHDSRKIWCSVRHHMYLPHIFKIYIYTHIHAHTNTLRLVPADPQHQHPRPRMIVSVIPAGIIGSSVKSAWRISRRAPRAAVRRNEWCELKCRIMAVSQKWSDSLDILCAHHFVYVRLFRSGSSNNIAKS